MDQEPSTMSPTTPEKPAKKSHRKTALLCLLVAVLMFASAGAAYYYRDTLAHEAEQKQAATIASLEKSNAELEKQLATEKTTPETTDPVACTNGTKTPSAATIENIKASVTSGNTAALEGYMASSVNVIFAASEGLGARTPAQAVSDISGFIGDSTTTTWDFALGNSTLAAYDSGDYGQYFSANSVVGKSSTSKVISFSFDCNAKINTVFMSASADIL